MKTARAIFISSFAISAGACLDLSDKGDDNSHAASGTGGGQNLDGAADWIAAGGSNSGGSNSGGASSGGSGASSAGSGGEGAATDAAIESGCSDGTREAYQDEKDIAACAGGFEQSGVLNAVPACNKAAGNDSANPKGQGCSAADLCASSWHICRDAGDVYAKSISHACPMDPKADFANGFWATAQHMNSSNACDQAGSNNVVGCCKQSWPETLTGCDPLNAFITISNCNIKCSSGCGTWSCTNGQECDGPWDCGTDGGNEGANVKKAGSNVGGVLCCHD